MSTSPISTGADYSEGERGRAAHQIATLLAQESPLHPNPTYLKPSPLHTMTPHHRERVVKYINELAEDFGLLVQTGGLACNYFDRYIATLLRKGPVSKSMMQMVASTCLLLAAKFFDRKLPPLSELETVHSGSVAAQQFADLEADILATINWQLHVPMPHAFVQPLRALLPDAPCHSVIDDRIQFFIDLSAYGYELLKYSPAEISAGALLAAWTFSDEAEAVQHYIAALAWGCCSKEKRLSDCANALIKYYQVCFPDAAKSHKQNNLFMPIPDKAQEEPRDGAASPDSITDALAMPDGPC
uniref:Cyclin-like domain-containing protein n=1 Tax=Haptolina brevifila TaxID=156173 RepID=A0A7S2D9T7_9EUKA